MTTIHEPERSTRDHRTSGAAAVASWAGPSAPSTTGRPVPGGPVSGRPVPAADGTAMHPATRYVAAALRLLLGWIFLWAFLDKVFGLGFATPSERSWINGGSPTNGFLSGSEGPFQGLWTAVAGQPWADWLFMAALLGIGTALLLGIGMRVTAVAAAAMYALMWTVVLPPATNPFADDHLIAALAVVLVTLVGAGHTLGLGTWWNGLPIVRRAPWLR